METKQNQISETDFPDKISETLNGFGPNMQYSGQVSVAHMQTVRRSPIPDADEIVKYPKDFQDQFLQSLKDRQAMAEKEQQHRHECENKQLEYDQQNVIRAFGILKMCAFFGFLVLLIIIGAAVLCANAGHDGVAKVFASTTIAVILGAAIKLIHGVKDSEKSKAE